MTLPGAQLVWCTGDLHLENFGTFRAENGLAYFDLTDFDEAALAPATWKVSRFVMSIFVAAASGVVDAALPMQLAITFLDTHRTALMAGKTLWIERATTTGIARKLLHRVKRRSNADLLDSRTTRCRHRQPGIRALRPAGEADARFASVAYVLRELQPIEDRIGLSPKWRLDVLATAVREMGLATAWAQLRSASRDGAAPIDDLIAFARGRSRSVAVVPGRRTEPFATDRDEVQHAADVTVCALVIPPGLIRHARSSRLRPPNEQLHPQLPVRLTDLPETDAYICRTNRERSMRIRDHACALKSHRRVVAYHCRGSARIWFLCVVMCLGTLAAMPAARAQTATSALYPFPDTSFVTDKVIASGRIVFRGSGGCIICHGQNLQGVIGPTLLEHLWKDAKGGSMAEIFRIVVSGVPNTAMIARPNGINDEQIRQVAAYVWAVNHRHAQP